MTITTRNQLVAKYASKQTLSFFRASQTGLAGSAQFSTWRGTSLPLQGAIPAAAALCTKSTTGAMQFNNAPTTIANYLAEAEITIATAAGANMTIEVHDRLAHMGGLSGIVITAQTVAVNLLTLAPSAARIGASDYSDVTWWLEWYTATGATGVTATLGLTYDDGSTGTLAVTIAANTGGNRMLPITAIVAGRYIRSVDTLTLSATTVTAGSLVSQQQDSAQ